ncbi:uncharacterized protein CELE_Y110A2AL.6 [Caenorhabditis elegans]|uniref:Secreted protein n=1 Tax=Caenorhabditis elegans TaxID=6239 RepID=Q9N4A3_CAEEL|nr:Secreted protein [Caenorhabditis elegans]CCD72976.1 Secreted protein [Caenorhabditis elegans]|eukprot:NP_494381.2 Uncharacterized protein CELE_Y110A2AL.6 [Caenorhabditis elegans]
MLFCPLLLIFLIANSNGEPLPPDMKDLQNHLDTFQKAVDTGDKKALREMMPVNQRISEEKLDEFIKTRKSFKMTAKSAQATSSGITGKVDYAIGKATLLLDVVLEKSSSSPSAYKFVSISKQSIPSQRREIPDCFYTLLIMCPYDLIVALAQTAENVLKG